MTTTLRATLASVVLSAGICVAAPITTTCPGSTRYTGPIAASVFLAPGFACQQQDKIYSDFTATGFPSDATLAIAYAPVGGTDRHAVTFGGVFDSLFTISYTITVDPAATREYIRTIKGDIEADDTLPTVAKSVTALSGLILSGTNPIVSSQNSAGVPLNVFGKSFRITDTFTPNGSVAYSIDNVFIESPVPEPVVTVLVGVALLTFGLVARRKKIA